MSGVKDYIIDIEKQQEEVKEAKQKVTPKVEYTLVLENDMDFVINRKSARSDKDLVFLVSQELFYIKDNKTNDIKKLDYENCKRMIGQFQKDRDKWIEFEKVTWTKNSFTDKLVEIIQNDQKRLGVKEGFGNQTLYTLERIAPFIGQNKKLLRYYFEQIKTFSNTDLLTAVFYIERNFNYNNAKYLIDLYANDTRFNRGGYIDRMVQILNMKFIEFDTNTFLDYITSGLYSQGIDCIDWSLISTYKDYLTMVKEMYGKVKEKYPKHLKTEHDKVVLKYNLWKKYKKDFEVFNITEEQRALEYKGRTFSIVIPETSVDIIDEAVNQCNCVASYIDNIVQGNTFVCFMRENSDLSNSYITIEIKHGKDIVQVKGFANRNPIKDEMDFVKAWAKAKKLTLQI